MTNLLEVHLEKWMDDAAQSLASSLHKIALFEREGIYVEYWIQNELAFCLPWCDGGRFLVDQGQGLVTVKGVKYPDFLLCFPGSPTVYFLELKDLLVERNVSKNIDALVETTKLMALSASREKTMLRWRKARPKKFRNFAECMEDKTFAFGGIGFGRTGVTTEDFSLGIPGNQRRWKVGEEWELSLLLADTDFD